MTIGQLKKVKIDVLIKSKLKPLDIYLFIDQKTIKIINKNSENYHQELNHYKSKLIESVFVSVDDFNSIIAQISTLLTQKNRKLANLSLEVAEDSYNYLKVRLGELTISTLEIDSMNQSINGFIASLASSPQKFQDRLKVFLNRRDYILTHTLMVSYVATLVAKKLDWHNEQILQKIHFASFFKDIFLDNPYLAKIRHLDSKEFKDLSKENQDLVIHHARHAIEYLGQIDYLPQEVEAMIINHHELPDDSGFNRKLAADQLSPLTCTFIVSCYFCQEYLENHQKRQVNEILSEMEALFNKGNYKGPLKALTSVFKN